MKASKPYKVGRLLFYFFFKVLGLRVEGAENVPEKGGVIIAPNHRSNYDPPLVGSCIASRPVFFLAKKELFANKFISWILKTVHAIPVDTENPGVKTMRIFVELLRKGKAVIIFPEGSRSKTNEFLSARPGVGYMSIKTNAPVVPVLITGTHESMLNHFLRKTPFTLKFGRPIYPDYKRPDSKNAMEFAEKVMEKIKGLT